MKIGHSLQGKYRVGDAKTPQGRGGRLLWQKLGTAGDRALRPTENIY